MEATLMNLDEINTDFYGDVTSLEINTTFMHGKPHLGVAVFQNWEDLNPTPEYTIVHSVLLGEVSCRVVARGAGSFKYMFSAPVRATVRNGTLIVTDMEVA